MKKIQSSLENLATDLVRLPQVYLPLMRFQYNMAGVIPDPKQAHGQGEELKEETNANFVQ